MALVPDPSVAIDVLALDEPRTVLLAVSPVYVITTIIVVRAVREFFDLFKT